jgi:hypothetical protein
MTIAVSDGVTTINPVLREGYQHTRKGLNVVHVIIGDTEPDVSLHGCLFRAGTMTLVFDDESDAFAADDMLATDAVFTITHSDLAAADMSFVVDGDLALEQDDTRSVYLLTVPFQEVS